MAGTTRTAEAAAGSTQTTEPAAHAQRTEPAAHAQKSDSAGASARVPILLDPSGGADLLPVDRDVAANRPRFTRSRLLVFAGAGALLVVVAAVAVLTLPHGSGDPSAAETGAAQATPPGAGQSALAPGQPIVTVSRVNASQVEFKWTYANPAPGDTFRWQEVRGTTADRAGIATRPDLPFAAAKGQNVCIIVTVRSADGEASPPSNYVCSPK
jgi:hypothetical protein